MPSDCALLVDLQSVHGFRCCDNSTNREVSASACTHLRLVWDSGVGGLMQKEQCAFLRELLAEDSMRSDE